MIDQDQVLISNLQQYSKRAMVFCRSLSPRQGEILEYMVLGYRNEKIADELGLKPKTIKNTIRVVFRKLNPSTEEDPRVMAVALWYIYNRRKLAKVKSRPVQPS